MCFYPTRRYAGQDRLLMVQLFNEQCALNFALASNTHVGFLRIITFNLFLNITLISTLGMMLLFCMTMMFCVSCPLITPFGLIYFIIKHYVDRHNIFFVYKPSKINKKVHASAISFIVLSTVVLQFFMTIFSVLRSGAALNELTLRSKYAVGLFLVSVNIFSGTLRSDDNCW